MQGTHHLLVFPEFTASEACEMLELPLVEVHSATSETALETASGFAA